MRGRHGRRRPFCAATSARSRVRCSFPPNDAQRDELLQLLVLEKALYELNYELNNRPDWLRIPLAGILSLLP